MSGEFEDRENELLGELPPVISRERRENYHPRDVAGVRRVPLDVAANARALEQQQGAPIGTPAIIAQTTTTYDARPINARDWVLQRYIGLKLPVTDTDAIITITKTVSAGFIAILRKIKISLEFPVTLGVTGVVANAATDITAVIAALVPTYKLYVNNIVVPNYDALIYSADERYVDTFVMASENQTISVEIYFSNAFLLAYNALSADPGFSAAVRVDMYGQELLARGLPLPFEVASQNTGVTP